MKSILNLRSSPSTTPVALASKAVPGKAKPSIRARLAIAISTAFVLTQAAHALNPQPLPPRQGVMVDRWARVALNPQPLPPRDVTVGLASRVALNPQPLPPRIAIPNAIRYGFQR